MSTAFSFPMRVLPNGSLATVRQDSDQSNAEEIAAICLVVRGERSLNRAYGLPDPTFFGIERAELVSQIKRFGPPSIKLNDVKIDAVSDSVYDVKVTFDVAEDDDQFVTA